MAKTQTILNDPQAVTNDSVVHVREGFRNEDQNPRRADTGAHRRFAFLQSAHGLTVADATEQWKAKGKTDEDFSGNYRFMDELRYSMRPGRKSELGYVGVINS